MPEEENKSIFDEVEGKTELEQTEVIVDKPAVSKEQSVAELGERRAEILENGTLAELDEVDEALEEKEAELKAPSIDDLDEVPDAEKYRMITPDTVVPDKLVLTIEDVYLQAPALKKFSGEPIEPTQSSNGKYYKAKVGLKFAEELNGTKIKQTIPSIYYSVDDNGQIAKVPGVPKACSKDDLDNNMTPSVGKMRHLYCAFLGLAPNTVSNKDFLKGLTGKKVEVKKESGVYEGRKWAKLKVVKFVK